MPCESCIDKLARRLMQNHKIDMIRAYELAEKAIERVENRDVKTPEVKSGNPTDYTKPCTQGTCADSYGCTKEGLPCVTALDCAGGTCTVTGSCDCPSPLSHSHQVSSCSQLCGITGTCQKCIGNECTPSCAVISCSSGTCGYDCDSGYVWNPVTLACELPSVAIASKRLLVGVGL